MAVPDNPQGCSCEFVHRSNPTCPSEAPSHGAIKDAPTDGGHSCDAGYAHSDPVWPDPAR